MYHVITNHPVCTISTDRGDPPRLLQVQDQDGVSQRPQPHLGGDLRDGGPPARARLCPVHGESFALRITPTYLPSYENIVLWYLPNEKWLHNRG